MSARRSGSAGERPEATLGFVGAVMTSLLALQAVTGSHSYEHDSVTKFYDASWVDGLDLNHYHVVQGGFGGGRCARRPLPARRPSARVPHPHEQGE